MDSKVEERSIWIRVLLVIVIVLGSVVIMPILAGYMLPTALAWLFYRGKGGRKDRNIKTIAIVNALVAWTGIGLLVMLFWVSWPATSQKQIIPIVETD